MTAPIFRLSLALLLPLLAACAPQAPSTAAGANTAASPAASASAAPAAPTAPASFGPIPADTAPAASLADVKAAAGKEVVEGRHVRFETTQGPIEVVLFPEAAPKAVENLTKLANEGFYDGTTFHRVIAGFVAQGGDPNSKTMAAGDPRIGSGGPGYTIPDEHGNGLKHLRGSLAMAHSAAANSAGSQFYICLRAQSVLDGKYTVFGHVVAGMDTVDKLTKTEGGRPAGATPDKMNRVVVLP